MGSKDRGNAVSQWVLVGDYGGLLSNDSKVQGPVKDVRSSGLQEAEPKALYPKP